MSDKKTRILIVDDEPNNLRLMMQVLNDIYELSFAANGMKTLEIVQKINFDMILLDIMMPEMDGYELCKRLKADEKTKHIPIIFVTAKDDSNDEAKGLQLGAIDYIVKPISPAIVKARLKNHLELKFAREEIERQNKELIHAAALKEDVDNIVRHDLKTPLNAIINCPRLIKMETGLSKDQMSYLDMIESSGLMMLNMINTSLDLFKMEKGVYSFHPEQINILEIIERSIKEIKYLTHALPSFNIIVNNSPQTKEDILLIKGEMLLCYSMMTNLIKNACEASPKHESVTISCDNNNNNNKVFISIHNKGAVPEAIRDKFFDKYVTYKKKSGTGLGTYSAKLMAETQGGSISFNTSEEKGTIITVCMQA